MKGKGAAMSASWQHEMVPFSLVFNLLLFGCSVMSDCEPMDCSTPGFSLLHHLLAFAETHVH